MQYSDQDIVLKISEEQKIYLDELNLFKEIFRTKHGEHYKKDNVGGNNLIYNRSG